MKPIWFCWEGTICNPQYLCCPGGGGCSECINS
jgi:hypothetical protein